jgi:hypothetical protein
MSLKTLLQKIGEDISSIFNKTVKELDTVILPAAIAVTNTVKTILTLDTTDILGKLAGSAGAALEDKVKAILAALVPKLQLAQSFLASSSDPGTILAEIVKLLPNVPAVTQTAFYIEFSSMLATDLAPSGELTLGQATQLAQYFYANNPSAVPAAPTTTA